MEIPKLRMTRLSGDGPGSDRTSTTAAPSSMEGDHRSGLSMQRSHGLRPRPGGLRRLAAAGSIVAAAALAALGPPVTALAIIPGPDGGGGRPPALPPPQKLTCRVWFGGPQFINWDILVHLNPDGTAKSAAPLGDAYSTGVNFFTPERTDPDQISIGNGGRSLHFRGSVLPQIGIPNTPASLTGAPLTCAADFSFPNPQSPVTVVGSH
jgi:hypothetical protein